jgi:hypothetical protein
MGIVNCGFRESTAQKNIRFEADGRVKRLEHPIEFVC